MIVGVDLELLKDADDPMLQRLQSSLIDDTDVVHELLHASGVRLALSLSPYAAAGAAGLADPCLMRVQYTHASHPSHLLLPGPSKHLKSS